VEPRGKTPGGYLFSIWSRDTSSLGTSGTSRTTMTRSAPCRTRLSAGLLHHKRGRSAARRCQRGTPVTITGTASGCPNPYTSSGCSLPAKSGRWSVPYATSQSFNWSRPASRRPVQLLGLAGTPTVQGPKATPPNTYDVFSAFQYTLTTAPCTALTLVFTTLASAGGERRSHHRIASGCPNPLRFWMQSPDGQLDPRQGYSRTKR